MVENLEMYIMIFFTYSFLGWSMESFGSIIKEKKFVNRGFLIGPYCPIYGTGVVLISLFLNKYTKDIPVLFLLTTLICGGLEYLTSYLMEKLFNARWWDYSKRKFNINGRICLETLIPFGITGTIILCFLNPFFINIYLILPNVMLKIIAYSLSIIYLIDIFISFGIIISFKKETYKQEDNTEEISNMVKDKAEDILMKAESDIIVFSRRLRLKELRMQRKIHYKSKKIYSRLKQKSIEFNKKVYENRKSIDIKIQENKEKINLRIKDVKENIEQKIQNINITSEEFTKQVKERFKKKSLLKNRLIEAFPNLKIENKNTNKKDKS